MRKIFVFLALSSVMLLALATGGWAYELRYSYRFEVPKVVKGPDGVLLEIPNCTDCVNIGHWQKPMLPTKGLKLLIPYGYDVESVKVEAGDVVELKLPGKVRFAHRQYPLSYKGPELPDGPDASVYGSAEPYPGVRYGNVMVQHKQGYEILVLTLFPVDYLPAKDTARIYKDMTLVVHLKEEAKDAPRKIAIRDLEPDRLAVAKVVDNPEVLKTYPQSAPATVKSKLDEGDYRYVIIAPEQFIGLDGENTLEDLVANKEMQGITATIVSYESIIANYSGRDDAEKVRNFVIDAYNSWNTEFILLVGDSDASAVGGESQAALIPKRDLWSSTDYWYSDYIPADMYFVCLDGDFNYDGDNIWGEPNDGPDGGEVDLMHELYIGRLCADSADEIRNFVRKTLAYFSYDPSEDFMKSALMVGELLWTWPVYTWGGDYKDEIKNGASSWGYTTVGFPEGWTVNTLYDKNGTWSGNQLIDIVNSDTYSIINHLGHSYVDYNMKIYTTNVDANFSNTKYFFAYSQGCYPGAFDNRNDWGMVMGIDCIAEHFTLTEHGMFAFVGNSRYGWGEYGSTNGSSQYFDRQFFDAIFSENIYELGWINADSKEDNIPFLDYGANRWCYFELNLFGDPQARLVCPLVTRADFQADNTEACVDEEIAFTDASVGAIDTYLWDFGDGTTSDEQNPTHSYSQAGTYTVSLTVSGTCGEDTKVEENYITVHSKPAADFTASATKVKTGETVEFTDASTGEITSWLWDFGDGTTSNEQNPSHAYQKAGEYTVVLTVSGPCGESSKELKITVSSPGGSDEDSGGIAGCGCAM